MDYWDSPKNSKRELFRKFRYAVTNEEKISILAEFVGLNLTLKIEGMTGKEIEKLEQEEYNRW